MLVFFTIAMLSLQLLLVSLSNHCPCPRIWQWTFEKVDPVRRRPQIKAGRFLESIEILIRCLKVTYLVLELYLEIGIGVFFLLDEMLKLRRINHYLHLGLKLLFLKELRILLLRLLFNRLWLALRQFLRR